MMVGSKLREAENTIQFYRQMFLFVGMIVKIEEKAETVIVHTQSSFIRE